MKKKQFLAVALGSMMLFGTAAAGCGEDENEGRPDPSKTTVLKVMSHYGGIGNEWLYKAIDRFEAAYADKVYAEGKKGVEFDPPIESQSVPTSLSTEGYHIYFTEQKDRAIVYAQNGTWMDLTDIVRAKNETRDGVAISIEDKLAENMKSSIMIGDKYYALPHYEYYGGLTYSVDVYEGIRNQEGVGSEQMLYLAKEDAATKTTNYTSSTFGCTIRLVNDLEDKSCGPDGTFGTEDDGLPGSWAEFLTLMEYQKEELAMMPMQLSGMYLNYSDLFMIGTWTQLAGDRMRTYFSMDGEIEVVYGESDENLFPGIDYIKKPLTKKVVVDDTVNTKAVFNMVERYYAQAILTIIEREDFFTEVSRTETVNHHDTQLHYLYSGFDNYTVSPYLMEGSFWHNESKIVGNHASLSNDYFYADYGEGRRHGWMSLPVTMYGTIVEDDERAHGLTVVDQAGAWCFANAKFENDPEISAAIKDFIAFLYSDAELSHFTGETGLAKPFDYELQQADLDEMPYIYKNLWNQREKGTVVYNGGTSQGYKDNSSQLMFTFGYTNFMTSSGIFLQKIRDNAKTTLWDLFKGTIKPYES